MKPIAGRRIAFDVLFRVETGGAYASRALDAALATAGAIDPRESGLATEIVYGTLRRVLTLDAALTRLSNRPLSGLDPAARVALRIGAYELLYLRTPHHAAVGEAVGLARLFDHGRASGYVNAVLRALARDPQLPPAPQVETDPAGHVAILESLPRFLAEEWVSWLGVEEALLLAKAMNQPAPLTVRTRDRELLLTRARAAGLEVLPTARSPHGVRLKSGPLALLARAAGDLSFQVQDEAAQLVSLLALGELRGQKARVLDACAAPGGKAFHLAEMLGQGSEVVAVELNPRKADVLAQEALKRGLNVRVVCADATKPIPGLEAQRFDAVLVDAPCAGLGTLRRHPELKLRRGAADLPRLHLVQRAIVENCATYARPGAPVTYAICSLSRTEGPQVTDALLQEGYRRMPPPHDFPEDVLDPAGDLLTRPDRHDGADGFYAARLLKA